MRNKTAIISAALLLGASVTALVIVGTVAGGGSAGDNALAIATSAPDALKSLGGSTTSGELSVPAADPAYNSDQTHISSDSTDSSSSSAIDRKIEREATLDITVEDVGLAVTRIESAAAAAGGFISQERITQATTSSNDDEKRQEASVQIRVPADKYDAVMADLRGVAKEVTSENSQTTEVTAQYTDLQSQLRNLQATESQYLTLMGQATSIGDILTVSDRLSSVRGQIEQIQGQIQLLDNLTAMATISIAVTMPPLPSITEPSDQGWAAEAWTNAWDASLDVLQALGTGAITVGVVLAWLLIPGLAVLGGWRLAGSRRKTGGATSA